MKDILKTLVESEYFPVIIFFLAIAVCVPLTTYIIYNNDASITIKAMENGYVQKPVTDSCGRMHLVWVLDEKKPVEKGN